MNMLNIVKMKFDMHATNKSSCGSKNLPGGSTSYPSFPVLYIVSAEKWRGEAKGGAIYYPSLAPFPRCLLPNLFWVWGKKLKFPFMYLFIHESFKF